MREFEEHKTSSSSLLQGFYAFSSHAIRPNHEHYVLAYYLRQGSQIVTTNYGNFIPRAYEELYGQNTIHQKKDSLYYYETDRPYSGRIYHLHGISDDLETLGVNLSTVKTSLPQSFRETFEYWLKNDYCFIFLGYSGLDSLDINRYLLTLETSDCSTGIYIKHMQPVNCPKITKNERILLLPFHKPFLCPCITDDFLRLLKEFPDKDPDHKSQPESDWQSEFKALSKGYSQEESMTFLLGLCYRLGLNITKILPSPKSLLEIQSFTCVDHWYRTYYPFQNAVLSGNGRLIRKLKKSLSATNDMLTKMDLNTAADQTDKAIEHTDSLSEIKNKLERKKLFNQIIDWDISTPLKCYGDLYVKNILKYPHSVETLLGRPQAQYDLSVLIHCFQMIIRDSYDKVRDVNQINTAYRSLALCRLLKEKDLDTAEEYMNIALSNYSDVSSLNGIVSTHLNMVVLQLIGYRTLRNPDCMEKARMYLKKAKYIITNCNMKKYNKRLFHLYILTSLYSF
ncbi:MAG: hypothetical protein HFG72_00400 [Hungatella sp.]|nr:hypothetical protein [Hungatella sp.]